MKASAPNWLVVGFQVVEKIFRPSALNHDEACWLVETAIRTRITSTSRPDASATTWKARSPSGRRSDKGWVDPVGPAGSTFVTVLTAAGPGGPRGAGATPWRARWPSGRRSDKGWVDPVGPAGSTFVTVLTAAGRSDPCASRCSRQSRADLAYLRLGHLVDLGRHRRETQTGEQLLAGSNQVADPCLEHLRSGLA